MEQNKEEEQTLKTCLHRLYGECPECKRDYENEINNTSCPKYYEVNLTII